jgi:hypothetical protein
VLTGKELRGPIHASRLTAYIELENGYRLTQARSKPCMFAEHTSSRKISVKVIVGTVSFRHSNGGGGPGRSVGPPGENFPGGPRFKIFFEALPETRS